MDPVSPQIGNDSPPLRSTTTILGSFLRGSRPRGISTSAAQQPPTLDINNRELSPVPNSPSVQTPPSPGPGHRRRPAAAATIQASISHNTPSVTPTSGPSLGLSNMLRRRRSAGTIANAGSVPPAPTNAPRAPAASASSSGGPSHRIRLVPHLDSRRSLRFEPICRDLKEGDPALRIGRFTDRSGLGLAATNALGSNKLAFKSKVVSRAHAEIWVESGGKFYIKDTKSSSGTFLNHVRLSPAGAESRQHQLKDGDILQLGVDYQGGAEDIYKSVKIRIEVGREWQSAANAFNTNAIKQLKSLAVPVGQSGPPDPKVPVPKSNIPDCCICLFSVTIRQALFIAPCSHTFHYKCIRPLLEAHQPAFCCPLCRTFADLEEDVEVENQNDNVEQDDDAVAGEGAVTIPGTGGERERENERERDAAGAETEVEPDTGATRLGVGLGNASRRTRAIRAGMMNTVVDLTEPDTQEDEDMLDAEPLPPLPVDDDDSGEAPRSASVSPDLMAMAARPVVMVNGSGSGLASGSGPVSGAGIVRPNGTGEYSSEGEGSGSAGSHEGVGVGMDSEPIGSGGEGGESTIGGKRKR